ncbi:MAG: isochorismatase family cysteine hydrolase [Thermoplasmata archaeon]
MEDTTKRALLTIDMTNDFTLKSYNPNLAFDGAHAIVPQIRRLQDAFVDANLPVIYSTDRHLPTDFELKKWGPHSMKGSDGSKIVEGLRTDGVHTLEREWRPEEVQEVDADHLLWEVEKGTYSLFTDNGGRPTAMDTVLARLRFEAGDELYITGVHTNCCDMHAAMDAFFRGYVPVTVRDATAGFADPDGDLGMGPEEALSYARYWYNAEIRSLDEVLKGLA